MKVLIVDYGMSNLGSIRRAVEECGATAQISDDSRDLKTADKIILPGVGAFADGIKNLKNMGWIENLRHAVMVNSIPMLGICLGMQLMATVGHECGINEGLDFIPGEVRKLKSSSLTERIPHIGWNEVGQLPGNPLFQGIPDRADFYFVHSYHFVPEKVEHKSGITPYCGEITTVIRKDNIFGVQFHPEKSGRLGFQLLTNFLEY